MKVFRENLPDAVEQALSRCIERASASECGQAELQDLQIARQALELIASELRTGTVHARQPRSGLFSRYVVDEESRMVMDPALRDLIVKIEDIYRRI